MTLKSRRFLVSVLLLLLPLQATATLTVCPHSRFTTTESGSAPAEHCLQSQAGNPDQSPDNTGNPQQSDPAPGSCCTSVAACSMCSIAVNIQPFPVFERPSQTSSYFLSAQFTSFIPEGIQRPPSILA